MFTVRNQKCPHLGCNGRVGIHSRQNKRFRCAKCRRTWVENYATPFFGLRSPKEVIDKFLILARNGLSVRIIARSLGKSPATIQQWKSRFYNLIHSSL